MSFSKEWEQYYVDLKRHEEHWQARKPSQNDYATSSEYKKALGEWEMNKFCMRPNQPGSNFCNND